MCFNFVMAGREAPHCEDPTIKQRADTTRRQPRKHLTALCKQSQRRRIRDDFVVVQQSSVRDSVTSRGDNASASDSVDFSSSDVYVDLEDEASDMNIDETDILNQPYESESHSGCESLQGPICHETLFSNELEVDRFLPQPEDEPGFEGNSCFETRDIGALNVDCEMCTGCTCIDCNICYHSSEGNCNHCVTCVCEGASDTDVILASDEDISLASDNDMVLGSENASESEGKLDPVLSEEDALNKAIKKDFTDIFLKHNVDHATINDLLAAFRKYDFGKFPKCAKTLLKTAKVVELKNVPPGLYWHNGVTKQLVEYAKQTRCTVIDVNVSSDGVPLFHSAASAFIPLTCSFNQDPEVHVIGLYLGDEKPLDSNVYFEDFVHEIVPLCQNGLTVENKSVTVNVAMGVFDAPSKSFSLCVMGCTSRHGCFKCTTEGEYVDRRMCFPDLKAKLRTDEDFSNLLYEEYHKARTILDTIPRFGCVSCVPLDYMHLVLLGIMRKLMYMWVGGPLAVRLSGRQVNLMSQLLISLVGWVPCEFARKPRSLLYLKRFKATEYRLLLLYVGVVAFHDFLPREVYENFLTLHVVISILVDPVLSQTYLEYTRQLSVFFVETFRDLYGVQFISHNVHSLIHLPDDVEKYGVLDRFSAFKFENFYQSLKSLVRKGEKPLQQVVKRYQEREANNFQPVKSCSKAMQASGRHLGSLIAGCTNPQFSSFTLKDGVVLNLSESDRCCLIDDSKIVVVDNFATDNEGQTVVIGREFLKSEDLYTLPCRSSLLNIVYAHQLSKRKFWRATRITRKCFRLPWKNGFAILPLRHMP